MKRYQDLITLDNADNTRADVGNYAATERWFAVARLNDAAKMVETARHAASPAGNANHSVSKPVVSTNIAQIMDCIRHAESGNYTESSHPGSGSGAYQWTPPSWAAWSARAGYPGYAFAYLAPASVQDAVTSFALTHGGAGNWSPRYGADSCTVGMGG